MWKRQLSGGFICEKIKRGKDKQSREREDWCGLPATWRRGHAVKGGPHFLCAKHYKSRPKRAYRPHVIEVFAQDLRVTRMQRANKPLDIR
jgi:hypothetical protein